MLFVILTVPMLSRPPPLKLAFKPWATVRDLRVKETPLFTDSTCTLFWPSRVTLWPLPSRVMLPLIVRVLFSVISPLQVKVIKSLALSVFAWEIAASRCDSSQVLTVMGAAA